MHRGHANAHLGLVRKSYKPCFFPIYSVFSLILGSIYLFLFFSFFTKLMERLWDRQFLKGPRAETSAHLIGIFLVILTYILTWIKGNPGEPWKHFYLLKNLPSSVPLSAAQAFKTFNPSKGPGIWQRARGGTFQGWRSWIIHIPRCLGRPSLLNLLV